MPSQIVRNLVLIVAIGGLTPFWNLAAAAVSKDTANRASDQQRMIRQYGALPLSFEPNDGQADPIAKYIARGPGFRVALLSDAVITQLDAGPAAAATGENDRAGRPTRIRINLIDANPKAKASDENLLPGTSNYFKGNDSTKYLTDIPTFGRVRFSDVYPNIDVVYYGNARQLEYDFVVSPGGDARRIRLAFEGATDSVLNADGDIVLHTSAGQVIQHRPVAYQETAGKRVPVSVQYTKVADSQFAVSLGTYDHARIVIIDPVFSYSTYIGGNGPDWGMAIAVDSAGNSYVTGMTASSDFPLVNSFDRSLGASDQDVFVAKLNPSGTALVYSTYLGGAKGVDSGFGIAVDSSGSAYVTGTTTGSDFPTTTGAYQTGVSGGGSFVTKLATGGNSLVYSTYLTNALVNSIALDQSGNAVVVGAATSSFATTGGVLQTTSQFSSGYTGFVLKLNASGTAPMDSTFLGGNGANCNCSAGDPADTVNAVALDQSGNAYVVGQTTSTNFPTANAIRSAPFPNNIAPDAFVSKLNPTGSALIFSTYLGGTDEDNALSVAVDAAGSAYIAGYTGAIDFPTKDAFQATNPGNTTQGASRVAFVTKLTPAGSALVYSSYLGGGCGTPGVSFCLFRNNGDYANAIAVDANGHAFVAGSTKSNRFPLVDSLDSSVPDGGQALFVAEVSRSGTALLYSAAVSSSSTVSISNIKRVTSAGLGGTIAEVALNGALGIALGSTGDAYVIGNSTVPTFPTTQGSLSTNYRGGPVDAVIFRFAASTASASLSSNQNPTTSAQTITLTGNVSGATGGSVTFYDGPTSLGTAALANGIATLSVSIPAGIHRITAVYRNGTVETDTPVLYEVVNQPQVCN